MAFILHNISHSDQGDHTERTPRDRNSDHYINSGGQNSSNIDTLKLDSNQTYTKGGQSNFSTVA